MMCNWIICLFWLCFFFRVKNDFVAVLMDNLSFWIWWDYFGKCVYWLDSLSLKRLFFVLIMYWIILYLKVFLERINNDCWIWLILWFINLVEFCYGWIGCGDCNLGYRLILLDLGVFLVGKIMNYVNFGCIWLFYCFLYLY